MGPRNFLQKHFAQRVDIRWEKYTRKGRVVETTMMEMVSTHQNNLSQGDWKVLETHKQQERYTQRRDALMVGKYYMCSD